MSALRTLPILAALPVVLVASAASAASFEVTLRPAYGGAGDASPTVYEPSGLVKLTDPDALYNQTLKPYGAGLNLQAYLGVRVSSWVSVGFMGGWRSNSATSDQAHDGLARSALMAGPYLRVYVPIVPVIEPWLGLGVSYVHDLQTWKGSIATTGGSRVVDQTLEHHGVAVPITVGADYKILPMLAAGLSFQYAPVFGVGGCYKAEGGGIASTSFCTDEASEKKITASKGYGMWSLGLNLRLTVPPT